jgi:hypothetical protein
MESSRWEFPSPPETIWCTPSTNPEKSTGFSNPGDCLHLKHSSGSPNTTDRILSSPSNVADATMFTPNTKHDAATLKIMGSTLWKLFLHFDIIIQPPSEQMWHIDLATTKKSIVVSPYLKNLVQNPPEGWIGACYFVLVDAANCLVRNSPPFSAAKTDVDQQYPQSGPGAMGPPPILSGQPLIFTIPTSGAVYKGIIDYALRNTHFIIKLAYEDHSYDFEFNGWPEEKAELMAQMAIVAETAGAAALDHKCPRVVGVLSDGRRWCFLKMENGREVMLSRVMDLARGDVADVVRGIVAAVEGW